MFAKVPLSQSLNKLHYCKVFEDKLEFLLKTGIVEIAKGRNMPSFTFQSQV